jgi:hypothetical protein
MSTHSVMADTPDADEKRLYLLGGISAIVLGFGYLVIFPLYARVGAPPNTGDVWMSYVQGKTTVWWAILALSVLTDLLFVPFALALYHALKAVNRNAMLMATACVGLFVVLDLAVTWANYASLLTLGGHYAAATSDAQRATYVAAANYASAVLASPLEIVYAIVVLSSGILVIGVVMLNGAFSKTMAWLGVATGVLGIACLAGSAVTIILNAVFATVWILWSGVRLCRLARW